jgi:hypothetical protein
MIKILLRSLNRCQKKLFPLILPDTKYGKRRGRRFCAGDSVHSRLQDVGCQRAPRIPQDADRPLTTPRHISRVTLRPTRCCSGTLQGSERTQLFTLVSRSQHKADPNQRRDAPHQTDGLVHYCNTPRTSLEA